MGGAKDPGGKWEEPENLEEKWEEPDTLKESGRGQRTWRKVDVAGEPGGKWKELKNLGVSGRSKRS